MYAARLPRTTLNFRTRFVNRAYNGPETCRRGVMQATVSFRRTNSKSQRIRTSKDGLSHSFKTSLESAAISTKMSLVVSAKFTRNPEGTLVWAPRTPDYLYIRLPRPPHLPKVLSSGLVMIPATGDLQSTLQPRPGQNPFVCNICKRTYSRLDHLGRHYRSRNSPSCSWW
jgi:hypothetical protein